MTDADASPARAYACTACSERWYPDRRRCPSCASTDFETYRLGVGELVAVTTAHVTPPDVREPNRLGLARFDGGVSLVAQLDADALTVGDSVRLAGEHVLRDRDGDDERAVTGPRLEPAE